MCVGRPGPVGVPFNCPKCGKIHMLQKEIEDCGHPKLGEVILLEGKQNDEKAGNAIEEVDLRRLSSQEEQDMILDGIEDVPRTRVKRCYVLKP